MTDHPACDIAIIGAGFSGLMALYHLVHGPHCPPRITVIDPAAFGRGLAYSTRNVHHLLNVRAKGMSALPDDGAHFLSWLNAPAGKNAAARLGLTDRAWQGDDFAPRALYALYLDDLKTAALATATAKGINISYLAFSADAIVPATDGGFAITLSDGSALRAGRCLLALGNLPQTTPAPSPRVISRVWDFDFTLLALTSAPVAIIGAGLTMVDIVIALRDGGYRGTITALSRNGWLPHTHDLRDSLPVTAAQELAGRPQRLGQLARALRSEIRVALAQGHSWQAALDRWRPYLPALWAQMSASDRRRFLKRCFTLWGIHRHRMAPAIGARIAAECAAGTLRVLGGGARIVSTDDSGADIAGADGTQRYDWVFDCRGPGYNLLTSDNTLLRQMAQAGLLRPDDTGWGVAVDADLKVAGQDGLYAIGPLAIGARLETTAVPELRGQAQALAQAMVGS